MSKLDKMLPHHFAEIFKAGGKKNLDILSYKEVQNDIENIKEWLAAALKEIRQLENKRVMSAKDLINGLKLDENSLVY